MDSQEFVDALLIPMRRRRDVYTEGFRREGRGSYNFDPAPEWAVDLVQRLKKHVLGRDVPGLDHLAFARYLLADRQRAMAASAVIDVEVAQAIESNKNWSKRLPLVVVTALVAKLRNLRGTFGDVP